eukprot:CAMPEP_0182513420 /NCGR_PEP_ID=MMETSP1321-20130603/33971_1 /TAXON_ID=91990 /ORGANISM="Bolidomonas sp., Strain RCC1657" /LENGTH=180 /DNA_ID=CAMNT_0024720433 /DNA_START=316 /DNA_END=858 /DNA_ORIENTATION=-
MNPKFRLATPLPLAFRRVGGSAGSESAVCSGDGNDRDIEPARSTPRSGSTTPAHEILSGKAGKQHSAAAIGYGPAYREAPPANFLEYRGLSGYFSESLVGKWKSLLTHTTSPILPSLSISRTLSTAGKYLVHIPSEQNKFFSAAKSNKYFASLCEQAKGFSTKQCFPAFNIISTTSRRKM